MDKPAAIYARVSSDQQKENHTIQSQTAALIAFAKTHGYAVPSQWQFQDEGYSGATLLRPGLEAVRDLAAAGQIAAVLVYSPDRLSRKYAYQVLLAEEFSCAGVDLVFLKSPSAATAEDQLLLQFQGMIAEYERAQIAERSRRGKRHRAQQGSINVLSGAPYGYRYVKKSETSAAYYQVVEAEAEVVRTIFEWFDRACLIYVLPPTTQVKYRGPRPPTPHYPLKFEITFCVRGVARDCALRRYLIAVSCERHQSVGKRLREHPKKLMESVECRLEQTRNPSTQIG
ncbi:MAG: recombinase family protein [Candidatus Sulfotelmatobacter sp.]